MPLRTGGRSYNRTGWGGSRQFNPVCPPCLQLKHALWGGSRPSRDTGRRLPNSASWDGHLRRSGNRSGNLICRCGDGRRPCRRKTEWLSSEVAASTTSSMGSSGAGTSTVTSLVSVGTAASSSAAPSMGGDGFSTSGCSFPP